MTVFELAKSELWINETCRALGIEDEERAYLALRAGLHALRDRLTIEEATHLAAQLPMMIRGLFFEGWHPGGKRVRSRSRESYLEAIEREMPHGKLAAEEVARAVFTVLDKHVSKGQIDNVRHSLPHQVAQLWQRPIALP
jgi:uncharacterized protein (DUF2267 family)